MYDFVDTTEYQAPGSMLPAEAMRFNGSWLENEIPGYRTLYVSGRESILAEITDQEVNTRDGNIYQRRRYKPRTLFVGYQLIAEDSEVFRRSYNKLNALMCTEEAQIVFADEWDKYFVGTIISVGEVPPGRNSVTAEIEIYCADPFKYSLEEQVVVASKTDTSAVFAFNYKGSYRTFPVLEAKMNGDNGFVSYLKKDNRILIGNEDELDGETRLFSESTVKDDFSNGPLSDWLLNNGGYFNFNAGYIETGTIEQTTTAKGNGIGVTDYGSGSVWHGPSITKIVPEDSSGAYCTGTFSLRWNHFFAAPNLTDRCVFQIVLTGYDDSGKKINIAGITLYRFSTGANNCEAVLFSNNKTLKKITFSRGTDNPISGTDVFQTDIRRALGDLITFGLPNGNYGFYVPEIAGIAVREISIFFGVYGDGTPGINQMISTELVVMNVPRLIDQPNLFSKDDEITADCRTGEILVNGNAALGYGDTANSWEKFYLSPGENYIECVCSPWAAELPDYKMRYREVFM